MADRLSAVKWHNWKMHLIWQVNMYDPPATLPESKVINLLTDLKEERDVGAKNSWVPHATEIMEDDPLSEVDTEFPSAGFNDLLHGLFKIRIRPHRSCSDFHEKNRIATTRCSRGIHVPFWILLEYHSTIRAQI